MGSGTGKKCVGKAFAGLSARLPWTEVCGEGTARPWAWSPGSAGPRFPTLAPGPPGGLASLEKSGSGVPASRPSRPPTQGEYGEREEHRAQSQRAGLCSSLGSSATVVSPHRGRYFLFSQRRELGGLCGLPCFAIPFLFEQPYTRRFWNLSHFNVHQA